MSHYENDALIFQCETNVITISCVEMTQDYWVKLVYIISEVNTHYVADVYLFVCHFIQSPQIHASLNQTESVFVFAHLSFEINQRFSNNDNKHVLYNIDACVLYRENYTSHVSSLDNNLNLFLRSGRLTDSVLFHPVWFEKFRLAVMDQQLKSNLRGVINCLTMSSVTCLRFSWCAAIMGWRVSMRSFFSSPVSRSPLP